MNLFSFTDASIVRPTGETILAHFDWTVADGETWAIVGAVATGKSSLLEAIVGNLRVGSGSLDWPLIDRLRSAGCIINWPAEIVRRVSFKEESRLFSYARHYYQQRFNFIEPENDLSLEAFLKSGASQDDQSVAAIAERFGIAALLPLSLIKLSNGQMRRARIARALLAHPELLLLDEPFIGLDAAGRMDVSRMLGELVRQGQRLILVTRPDAIPDWVTNVLDLGGKKSTPPRSGERRKPSYSPPRFGEGLSSIIELRNVTVAYEGKRILDDVTWTVRTGERWAVLGPNGSGKSTLLSLLCGDHPQAYSNDVRLFGRQRGSGESIWDIKQKVGLLSPELHLYFTVPMTAFQAAATGFHDVLTPRAIRPDQAETVRELFDYFDVPALSERSFRTLSTGEQRLVLLIRALVKQPPLLILDEPFQGLDDALIAKARSWIDENLSPDQTLLFVSHYAEEIPNSVTMRLELNEGQILNSRVPGTWRLSDSPPSP